jgi:hypothetical protein
MALIWAFRTPGMPAVNANLLKSKSEFEVWPWIWYDFVLC